MKEILISNESKNCSWFTYFNYLVAILLSFIPLWLAFHFGFCSVRTRLRHVRLMCFLCMEESSLCSFLNCRHGINSTLLQIFTVIKQSHSLFVGTFSVWPKNNTGEVNNKECSSTKEWSLCCAWEENKENNILREPEVGQCQSVCCSLCDEMGLVMPANLVPPHHHRNMGTSTLQASMDGVYLVVPQKAGEVAFRLAGVGSEQRLAV